MATTALDAPVRYRVTGMDCSSCAAKIEGAARTVAGVQERSSLNCLPGDDPARR